MHCFCPQAEESEEEEEDKSEASYDYLSPFLPPLIGMQQLSRDQVGFSDFNLVRLQD